MSKSDESRRAEVERARARFTKAIKTAKAKFEVETGMIITGIDIKLLSHMNGLKIDASVVMDVQINVTV